MDKNLKRALKLYLTNIFRKLPDSSKKRRKFIHLLKQNILDYIMHIFRERNCHAPQKNKCYYCFQKIIFVPE